MLLRPIATVVQSGDDLPLYSRAAVNDDFDDWTGQDSEQAAVPVPYLKLPSGSYRIPQGALLSSLRGNYDLGAELRELDERNTELTDEQVQAALAGD